MRAPTRLSPEAIQTAQKQWGWYLGIGILLGLLGIWSLINTLVAGLLSVMVLGFTLLLAGIFQIFGTFKSRGTEQIRPMTLLGLLDLVLGFLLIINPGMGLLMITVMLAILFIFVGGLRLAAALTFRTPNYGWTALSGAITGLLGILLLAQLPGSIWLIGFLIGLNFLFNGISWIAFALRLKSA